MEAQEKFEGKHSELTGKIVSCHCEEGVLPDEAISWIEKKM